MKKNSINSSILALIFLAIGTFSCQESNDPPVVNPGNPPAIDFTALAEGNQLYFYQEGDLDFPVDSKMISGLESGESIISIDYRPATGQLYGLSSASKLYLINENSGMATALSEMAFSPAIEGTSASLDFNPTVDRVRVVSESGQNLRLHPETGMVVAIDGSINGGMNPMIGAVAYSNSVSGATSTTLFDIDINQDKLYKQVPPNDGGLEEVGDLGEDFDGATDMDINPDNTYALAVSRTTSNQARLYLIDLASGNASWIGIFQEDVISVAFKTDPIAYATDAEGMFYRFNPMMPQPTMVALQGLGEGEEIVGLDFRPAKGQLLAVSNWSQLYSVNPSNGMLMKIGDPFTPMIEGTWVGFDFNPTVDRIRLVTDAGQNLRLHPDLGTVVAIDGDLNPGMPMVSAAAYSDNFAGTTQTTLFVLDHMDHMLYKQIPPNDGVLVAVGDLGLEFSEENGFDIGGMSGMAFALLQVSGVTGVYQIDLMTGEAMKVSDVSFSPNAMAVGLGF